MKIQIKKRIPLSLSSLLFLLFFALKKREKEEKEGRKRGFPFFNF